ncbi:MAG: ATP-binding protein [Pyrinomonadaceae bacterium]
MLVFLGLFVLVLLAVLILLQSSNLWKSFSIETASDTLMLYALSSLNFIAFVIFGFIFLRSIIKLARERRTLQLGSKIKTRLLLYFAAVSLLPIIAMAGFSYLFMNRALDRWFTQIPENVSRKALDVQAEAVADQSQELHETAGMLAAVLNKNTPESGELEAIADAGNLTFVGIFAKDGTPVAVREEPLAPDRKIELDSMVALIKSGNLTDPSLSDGRGFDAATAPMSSQRMLVIIPDLRDSDTVSQVVDKSLLEFDRLKDKQLTVRQIGLLTLGVLTFLLIFASSWTAFYIARGLTVPIRALAEGADEIARGNLKYRVDVVAEDELALLISAFNAMSAKLEENSAELATRRRYIETVLESVPTGVISLDESGKVSTINRTAAAILNTGGNASLGRTVGELAGPENLAILERVMARAIRIGQASEQTSLLRAKDDRSASSEIPVALTATALAENRGVVLVIEDLSELIAAQRASAWQEVARRMAHEIKNPLTPIQLSAERIAKRFRENGSSSDALHLTGDQTSMVVRDGTQTILREVQSLKAMVDEFSKFARLPTAKPESCDINTIARQALALFDDRGDDVRFDLELATDLPPIMADGEQVRRVFVNLIENAIEALDPEAKDNAIAVSTRYDLARDIIVCEVVDNGQGIEPVDLQKVFQPYFSTKGRGSGLGLAIVERIVIEHHGKIKVVGNSPRGAKFILEFPVL